VLSHALLLGVNSSEMLFMALLVLPAGRRIGWICGVSSKAFRLTSPDGLYCSDVFRPGGGMGGVPAIYACVVVPPPPRVVVKW